MLAESRCPMRQKSGLCVEGTEHPLVEDLDIEGAQNPRGPEKTSAYGGRRVLVKRRASYQPDVPFGIAAD